MISQPRVCIKGNQANFQFWTYLVTTTHDLSEYELMTFGIGLWEAYAEQQSDALPTEIVIHKTSLLIYDLQCEDWVNTYYMLKAFLKARRPPKVSNETKCIKEKVTWNTQDTNLSWYVPKVNVDHTINGQGTAISTLIHSATTPRARQTYDD